MLQEIELQNFRCFESLRLEVQSGVNFIIGDNAQGKTSILEGICCLLRLQSPRTSTLADGVKFRKAAFCLQGVFADTHLRLDYPPRSIAMDGKAQSRAGDYLRTGLVTWFSNDDMELIRGGAAGRRRYLDFICAQLEGTYLPSLRAYERALRSRNYLLKQLRSSRKEIEAWNDPLIEAGSVLLKVRERVLTALTPPIESATKAISGHAENVRIQYQPGMKGDFRECLGASAEEEARLRSTLVGPHRDDFQIFLHEANASGFASEGQQRTIALALKLAQVHVIESETGRMPILLIDDIFGELDPQRRNRLMTTLPASAQKIITTTHLSWLESDIAAPVFELSNRRISLREKQS